MNALLLLGLLVGIDKPKDETDIEGTWIILSSLADGSADDEVKGFKMTFKDGNITGQTKKKDEKGTYKLYSSAKPKAMDMTDEDKVRLVRAIYKLDGDKLTICAALRVDDKRPTEFASKRGTGHVLIEFQREKK